MRKIYVLFILPFWCLGADFSTLYKKHYRDAISELSKLKVRSSNKKLVTEMYNEFLNHQNSKNNNDITINLMLLSKVSYSLKTYDYDVNKKLISEYLYTLTEHDEDHIRAYTITNIGHLSRSKDYLFLKDGLLKENKDFKHYIWALYSNCNYRNDLASEKIEIKDKELRNYYNYRKNDLTDFFEC
ncbi:hypothetical protein [Pleionea mediterranea]|uniref:Uncharacterized protein n=1 Tax=Pleionea mediterranea TaxID=523701 RepID=A0A316G0C3_9GAMM|nr:hypothetical protein [Pleionea mediterranea]PWK54404.1 hypothetical protein C8D97_101252 [Pleionea mediterranea]